MARHRYMRRTNKRGQFHFREETATSFSFTVFTFPGESDSNRRVNKTKQATTCPRICEREKWRGRQDRTRQSEAGAQCGLWLRWLRFASSRIAEQQTKTSERTRRAGAEENREKDSGSRDRVPAARYPLPGTRYTGLGDYPAAREVN